MNQLKTLYAADGETLEVSNNWTAYCEKRAATVSASAWEFSGTGTITNESLDTPFATCLLTPTSYGCLENTVTLSNGEVLKAYRKVEF